MPGAQPWPQSIWWQASVFLKSPAGDSIVQPGLRPIALCKWHSQKQAKGDTIWISHKLHLWGDVISDTVFQFCHTSKFALFLDIAESIAWHQSPLPTEPNPNSLTWFIQLFKIWFLLLQPQKLAWLDTPVESNHMPGFFQLQAFVASLTPFLSFLTSPPTPVLGQLLLVFHVSSKLSLSSLPPQNWVRCTSCVLHSHSPLWTPSDALHHPALDLCSHPTDC